MTTFANTSLEHTQAQAGALGHILDSFIGLLTPRKAAVQNKSSFSELEHAFYATKGLPKSLLVVRVGQNAASDNDVDARQHHQKNVLKQLISVSGIRATVEPIGDNEIAVLLNGIDQCSELIARVEEMLSCIEPEPATRQSDNESRNCTVGIARCPIDADELNDSIRLASSAAEQNGSEHRYQFITRHQRRLVSGD
jgi:hypothetical protein